MIVVDTNVISAVMNDPADEKVVEWMKAQPVTSLWTTAISVFEIRLGLMALPEGRRRRALETAFNEALEIDLEGRVLPFDEGAALAAATVAAQRRKAGKPVDVRDIQIAGIASDRGATLATRNTKHFEGFGVRVVNPWTA